MAIYMVCDGNGNSVADGIQEVGRAERLADERLAADPNPNATYVVYDREDDPCTEECVGLECEHEVYRAERD